MPKGRYINFAALEEMYGTEVVEALRQQMEIEADRIVQDMKSRVPVRTGRLRDSIHWRWNKNKTAIEILADAPNPKNGVKYGRFVEFSPRINKPFFYPAMDAHRESYREALKAALRKAISRGIKNGSN